MKHIISVEVENKFGALARISGLFSARGFNIESLTVGETEDVDVSRMTIVVPGDDSVVEQVCKQLNKVIDVIRVRDLTEEGFFERELLLVRVSCAVAKRPEILELVELFKGKVLEVGQKHITIELSGDEEKVTAFLNLITSFGIKEIVRTGKIAIKKIETGK
jgi:acetolactate synthase I/III small subunit